MMQTQSNQPLGIAVQPVRNESGWGGFEGDRATDAVVERLARGGSLFVPPADRVRAALTDMGSTGLAHRPNSIGLPMPWVFNAF